MNGILEHSDYQHTEDVIAFMRRGFAENHGGLTVAEVPPNVGGMPTIIAFVNDSRWIVACPTEGCKSAFIVDSRMPFYLCIYCGNRTVNGAWLRVVFPAEKQAIEEQLLKRRRNAHRNWIPGEKVADLIRENQEHGVN